MCFVCAIFFPTWYAVHLEKKKKKKKDGESVVTVEVKENGTYMVSIIPVIERTGIIGSI